jgi:hypothetical protein
MYKNFTRKLLKNARHNRILSVLTIFLIIGTANVIFGWFISSDDEAWLDWFDHSGTLLGWISLMSAWAFGIRYWMLLKEINNNSFDVGESEPAKNAFDASLILASRNCQPEWHLRHIKPKRVEFLWTPMLTSEVDYLLDHFPKIECIESREKSLTNEQTYEIKQIKQKCKSLLQHLIIDYPKERICVDLTAGTSIMTIAAFQAAEEMGITSIYLLGNSKNQNNIYIIDEKKIHDPDEARMVIVSDKRK